MVPGKITNFKELSEFQTIKEFNESNKQFLEVHQEKFTKGSLSPFTSSHDIVSKSLAYAMQKSVRLFLPVMKKAAFPVPRLNACFAKQESLGSSPSITPSGTRADMLTTFLCSIVLTDRCHKN